MMKATIVSLARGYSILSLLVVFSVFSPVPVQAQYDVAPAAPGSFTREELAQLLAPVALYPDALLTQILMAATYPIEVVEADRWLRRNSHLQGEDLDWALAERDWDPSVKALCHFPSLLALMSERIAETSDLGNAFLAQEAEVMAMVQELRAAAYAQGNLRTNAQQTVIVERETIIIEPVNPLVVHVPYYDPFYVYGPWWYPAYPPYYWGPPGVSVVGISYWPGVYFSFSFGNWSYFDWHRRIIFIDAHKRPKYVRHGHWASKPGPWKHNSVHRRGVSYRDAGTARKYGQPYHRSVEDRRDRRGAPERGNVTRDRERRLEDRSWRNQEQRRDERSSLERNRPAASQPADRQRTVSERSGREGREPVRVDRNRQEREHVRRQDADRGRQQQQRVERQRQEQRRLEQGRPLRERAERQQVERSRDGRQGQRPGQEQQVRERVQGVPQPGRRDGNINQVQSGRKEYGASPGDGRQWQRGGQERQVRERLQRVEQPGSRNDGRKQVESARNGSGSRSSGQFDRQGMAAGNRGSGRAGDDSRSGREHRGGNWR